MTDTTTTASATTSTVTSATTGLQADPPEGLQSLLDELRNTRAEVYAQLLPQLQFLARSLHVPAAVRDLAATQLQQLRRFMVYWHTVQVKLTIWRAELLATLDTGRYGAGLVQEALAGPAGVELASGIDRFLTQQQHYLRAPAPARPAVPTALRGFDYRSHWNTGWETKARLFQHGTPLERNLNRRRFTFADNSYVDIQAHEPAVAYSTASDALAVGVFLASGLAVGVVVSGIMSYALMPGVVVGLALGIAAGGGGALLTYLKTRPHDAVWQGYTARYYSNAEACVASGTEYFYGWKRSDDRAQRVAINGSTDVATFQNFAHTPHDYSWWRWYTGHAAQRAAELEPDALPDPCAATVSLGGSAERLVQALAAFAPPSSASLAPLASVPDNGGAQLLGVPQAA